MLAVANLLSATACLAHQHFCCLCPSHAEATNTAVAAAVKQHPACMTALAALLQRLVLRLRAPGLGRRDSGQRAAGSSPVVLMGASQSIGGCLYAEVAGMQTPVQAAICLAHVEVGPSLSPSFVAATSIAILDCKAAPPCQLDC